MWVEMEVSSAVPSQCNVWGEFLNGFTWSEILRRYVGLGVWVCGWGGGGWTTVNHGRRACHRPQPASLHLTAIAVTTVVINSAAADVADSAAYPSNSPPACRPHF